jgi:hypothetical protein
MIDYDILFKWLKDIVNSIQPKYESDIYNSLKSKYDTIRYETIRNTITMWNIRYYYGIQYEYDSVKIPVCCFKNSISSFNSIYYDIILRYVSDNSILLLRYDTIQILLRTMLLILVCYQYWYVISDVIGTCMSFQKQHTQLPMY